ncbi:YchO/YchP family invasin [Rosenbergiella sp. S61]|uniref:YchO/YchP family invasin n=1 Tax=Rosenbergiella gaditana TaxID=2726987 RepID=A0ABS5ST73_9GAMM|nr:YchO/YchP family invasin [Rosenbergiella gaditana]MBT0723236.1 YchO/YchP family invasin [Rosenbergiella gaditana]
MFYIKRDPVSLTKVLMLLSPLLVVSRTQGSMLHPSTSDSTMNSASYVNTLPDLGSSQSSTSQVDQRLTDIATSLGKSLQNSDDNTSIGRSASEWAFNHVRDKLTEKVDSTGEHLLSPFGQANLSVNVDMEGNFTGSTGSLFTPLSDNGQRLTFSQLSINQSTLGTVGSAGLGQRFSNNQWLFGYNAFLDQLFTNNQQRGSIGTELWSHFLRFSANYYTPLSGWKNTSLSQSQRMARGYDITSQGYLPFYQQLGVTVSWQQYLGAGIDIFNDGNYYNNPRSMSVGLTYTPIPLVTVSASHKEGSGGTSQDVFGLNLNYHFGQSLSQQLSPYAVADARSLFGSRYDVVTRNNLPVMSYRKRQGFSVYLATPPWQLNSGDSITLVVQATPNKSIKSVEWQGDTRELSLTPPANTQQLSGWTIILPPWDNAPGAKNEYHLAVAVDNGKQRVTSNTITLKSEPPAQQPDYFNQGYAG